MRYILLLFLFISIYSCEQKQASQTSSKDAVENIRTPLVNEYLITDTSFGKINKTTTYNDLLSMFGKNNLEDTINFGPEGIDSFIVTKIFSNTPKEIVVKWQRDKFHNRISSVDFYQENSPYYSIDSLQVGSTLEKLVQVNGKKINFYGTGWDFGGLITSYNNGKFHRPGMFFRLDARDGASENIMGDQELNTDLPKVKPSLNKLYISHISIGLHNEK